MMNYEHRLAGIKAGRVGGVEADENSHRPAAIAAADPRPGRDLLRRLAPQYNDQRFETARSANALVSIEILAVRAQETVMPDFLKAGG